MAIISLGLHDDIKTWEHFLHNWSMRVTKHVHLVHQKKVHGWIFLNNIFDTAKMYGEGSMAEFQCSDMTTQQPVYSLLIQNWLLTTCTMFTQFSSTTTIMKNTYLKLQLHLPGVNKLIRKLLKLEYFGKKRVCVMAADALAPCKARSSADMGSFLSMNNNFSCM